MSREEVAAHLRNLQLSLDGLQRSLEARIAALPDTRRDDLPAVLAGLRRQLRGFFADQLRELEVFAEEAGCQLDGDAAAADEAGGADVAADMAASPASSAGQGTPLGVQLRSLQDRVARMGGTPALGACVLPRPLAQPSLNTTASPAAVEIMKGRLGGTDADATPLRRTSSGAGDKAAAPLVQLRATPAPAPGKAVTSPLGAAPPNSELAAAIQRRMQRMGSASPEKEAAVQAAEAAA